MEGRCGLLKSVSGHENNQRLAVNSTKFMPRAYPAVLISPTFPRHRVQKLLNRSDYIGVSAVVEAEGLFIQLTKDGVPFRQVFLGLTQREFFIIKQEIPKVTLHDKRDTEISDLVIDKILPLPIIRFIILDDSSKHLTILTNTGTRYCFEMCQLDLGSEEMWQKWREVVLRFSGHKENANLNTWKTSYVLALQCGVATRSDVKSANANPLSLMSVRSVGIQTKVTENITGNETPSDDNVIKGTSVTTSESDTESSSSSEFDHFETTRIGYRPNDRLAVLFTRSSFSPYLDMMKADTEDTILSDTENFMKVGIENAKGLRKIGSLNDVSDSQFSKFYTETSFMEKFQLSEAMDNVPASVNERCQSLNGVSESSCDLDEWIREKEFQMEHQKTARPARDLWTLVRIHVIQRNKFQVVWRFQDVVRQVQSRIVSQRDDSLAQSVIQLDVTDVSLQLTYITRKLFLAISATDLDIFTQSRGKEIRQSLRDILKFSEDVRKMVITEVLKSRRMSGSINVTKFYIQVCLKLLFQLHDFQSLIAIVRGLTSLPLYRLVNMWGKLFIQEPFAFCQFLTILQFLNPTKQHSAYVARVVTCLKRKSAFVPLLDHILEHCLKTAIKKRSDFHQYVSGLFLKKYSRELPTDFMAVEPHKDEKRRSDDIIQDKPNYVALSVEPGTQDFLNVRVNVVPRPVISHKPFLSKNSETRNSFRKIISKGYLTRLPLGKKPKHHVTFQTDPNTCDGLGKEEESKSFKQMTNKRIERIVNADQEDGLGIGDSIADKDRADKENGDTCRELYINNHKSYKDGGCEKNGTMSVINGKCVYRTRSESCKDVLYTSIDEKHVSVGGTKSNTSSDKDTCANRNDEERDKNCGDVYDVRCEAFLQKERPVITRFENNLTNSPVFMNYIHFQAKSILYSALKEVKELTENGEISRDSEDNGFVHREASLQERMQHHKSRKQIEGDSWAGDRQEKKDIETRWSSTKLKGIEVKANDDAFFESSGADTYGIKQGSSSEGRAELKDGDARKSKTDYIEDFQYEYNDAKKLRRKVETKASKKRKTIQNPQTVEKKFVFLRRVLKKIGKRGKTDFKHVKVLKKDIDEIADLMQSFKIFDCDEGECAPTTEVKNTADTILEQSDDIKTQRRSAHGMKRSFTTPADVEMVTDKATEDKNDATEVKKGHSNEFKTNTKSVPDKKMSVKRFCIEENRLISQGERSKATERKTNNCSVASKYLKRFDTGNDINASRQGKNDEIETFIGDEHKTNPESLPDFKTSSAVFNIVEDVNIPKAVRNSAKEEMTEHELNVRALPHIMSFREEVNVKDADDIATSVKNNAELTTINHNDYTKASKESLISVPRRKSYIPELVARGRRKSLFEEAIANRLGKDEENDVFEYLKRAKLNEQTKTKSTVFELLFPDEENLAKDDRNFKPAINSSKSSVKGSDTDVFRCNNKSNNSNLKATTDKYSAHSRRKSEVHHNARMKKNENCETENISLSGDRYPGNWKYSTAALKENLNQNSSVMFVKCDQDLVYSSNVNRRSVCYDAVVENVLDDGRCSLCGDKKCLYDSGIWNHFFNTQKSLLKIKLQSCQKVKEFLDSVFTINNYLTDFDILQLSNQSG